MPAKFDLKKTKEKIDSILAQAKESVQVLEALQKEGMARAKSLLQVPTKDLAQKITNEKVVSSLKKLGLATRSEVRELEKRVEELASELRTQINQVSKAAKKKSKSEKEDSSHEASV